MKFIQSYRKYKELGFFNFIFVGIEYVFSLNRLRLVKSIYLNLRCLPFRQALKLPIHIYGKNKIFSLAGKCYINAPIKYGMIRLGAARKEIALSSVKTYIRINGNIIFNGCFDLNSGGELNIKSGCLEIGDRVLIGEKVKILCTNKIIIGTGCRIAFESQIIDTNFHYVIDTETRTIDRCFGEISIGKYCWIASRCTVFKGTILPNDTIVASNSVLSKDYSAVIQPYSLIGGIPAKFIKSGIRRVFNHQSQVLLVNYFRENIDKEDYILLEDIDMNIFSY